MVAKHKVSLVRWSFLALIEITYHQKAKVFLQKYDQYISLKVKFCS